MFRPTRHLDGVADLAIADGNLLQDIATTTRVRHTVANGRVYDVRDLLRP